MQILSSLKNGLYAFTVAAATLLPRAALSQQAKVCLTSIPDGAKYNIGTPIAFRLHKMKPFSVWDPCIAVANPADCLNNPPLGSILTSSAEKTWTATPEQVTTDSTTGQVCFSVTTDTSDYNNCMVSILYKTSGHMTSRAEITSDPNHNPIYIGTAPDKVVEVRIDKTAPSPLYIQGAIHIIQITPNP